MPDHLAAPPEEEVETINDCFVGVHGDRICLGAAGMLGPSGSVEVEKALRCAAWIVCLAGAIRPDAEERFLTILRAVERT